MVLIAMLKSFSLHFCLRIRGFCDYFTIAMSAMPISIHILSMRELSR
jgi:hypothetical protein